jgi:hypothetical protein
MEEKSAFSSSSSSSKANGDNTNYVKLTRSSNKPELSLKSVNEKQSWKRLSKIQKKSESFD